MNAEFVAAAGVALMLGLRHGLDVDHLATIDGLTRAHTRPGRGIRAARCGLWFSTGHGLALVAIATLLALLGRSVAAPAWLAQSGPSVAVGTLLLLAAINLGAAWRAGPGSAPLTPRHWLAERWLAALGRRSSPGAAAFGAGLLFALSLDVFGAAALMAASATAAGAVWIAPALGLVFALGMVSVDGLVGWCSAWLLYRTPGRSTIAPRVSGVLLGLGCLVTAAALAGGMDERAGLALSAGVWLLVPLSYAAAWCWSLQEKRHG